MAQAPWTIKSTKRVLRWIFLLSHFFKVEFSAMFNQATKILLRRNFGRPSSHAWSYCNKAKISFSSLSDMAYSNHKSAEAKLQGLWDPQLTKIVATIGPTSEQLPEMQDLVRCGMRVMRLNFSHATVEEVELRTKNLNLCKVRWPNTMEMLERIIISSNYRIHWNWV